MAEGLVLGDECGGSALREQKETSMEESRVSARSLSFLPLFCSLSVSLLTCAIMNPELSPPLLTRKAGSALSCGLTRRSMRRSEMAAISWMPIVR
jgi:hypothetical protein